MKMRCLPGRWFIQASPAWLAGVNAPDDGAAAERAPRAAAATTEPAPTINERRDRIISSMLSSCGADYTAQAARIQRASVFKSGGFPYISRPIVKILAAHQTETITDPAPMAMVS